MRRSYLCSWAISRSPLLLRKKDQTTPKGIFFFFNLLSPPFKCKLGDCEGSCSSTGHANILCFYLSASSGDRTPLLMIMRGIVATSFCPEMCKSQFIFVRLQRQQKWPSGSRKRECTSLGSYLLSRKDISVQMQVGKMYINAELISVNVFPRFSKNI